MDEELRKDLLDLIDRYGAENVLAAMESAANLYRLWRAMKVMAKIEVVSRKS